MLDAYRDLIDELLETPKAIRDAIAENQSETASGQVAVEIARIRDHDLRILERARTMMQRDDAYFDNVPSGGAENTPSLDKALGEFETARGDLVSLLINLSLKDWERVGIMESRGEVTLSDIVEEHVEFDEAARLRLQEILQKG
jgi:hypothetical protein